MPEEARGYCDKVYLQAVFIMAENYCRNSNDRIIHRCITSGK
jgi:hypothetical protein